MSSGEPLIWIFFVIVACAAGLSLIAVRGGGSMPVRLGAMALMAALVGGGYAGLAELMSRPKPVTLEWVRGAAQSAPIFIRRSGKDCSLRDSSKSALVWR